MKFRTEIEPVRNDIAISHSDEIVMLGSCFTDSIGDLLARDGFSVTANPMGALYNPDSIRTVISKAMRGYEFDIDDLETDDEGIFHCLYFDSRHQGPDPHALLDSVNHDFAELGRRLRHANTWIITLGTAWVFEFDGGYTVGNCHKFPADRFTRVLLTVETAERLIRDIVALAGPRRVIFTVSPIRHLADGLHGNTISKSTLQLALFKSRVNYFPAFEILNDDLRDYRFYADDLRHPSAMAVQYIYEKFADTYFSAETRRKAQDASREALRRAHRPIIKPTQTK